MRLLYSEAMSVTGHLPGVPPDRRRLSAWLQEKLFERRIVLITGPLDDDAAAEAAAALMTLDAAGAAPIELHLDSQDGTLESAFLLIDTIDQLRAAVRVHGRGQVGGPALGLMAAGAHRSATAHTRFRLRQPTARFTGTPDQIAAYSRQQQELLWRFHARLAQATGRPAEEIAEDMRRGRSLDATEAREYGLIDEINATR
jgi:ATP-dependent Clp protease, protease subunit